MSNDSVITRLIFQSFKVKGLSITSQALQALVRVIKQEDQSNVKDIVDSILSELSDRIEKREVKSTVIDVKIIESIVADLSSSEEDIKLDSIQLFDAYSSPKLVYDERQKNYKVIASPSIKFFGDVTSRAQMYRERIHLTLQRLLRSGLFVVKGLSINGTAMQTDQHEISMVESLLGGHGTRLLFGMLTQPEEGAWHLEDLTSTIRLNLTHATYAEGILTEGCLVLALGEYMDGIFQVSNVGFPPAEERNKTLSSIGITDIFGNGFRPQHLQHYAALESEAVDSMLIFVSDIQIDKPQVYEKLQELFQGFEDTDISPLFILMGSFVSKSATVSGGREAVELSFKLLADAIASAPRIAEQGKFIIIPGNRDPGLSKILPRRAIPDIFLKDLKRKVRHVNFASNPCRLRFFTQEIVFFREDLLRKMQRHTVLPSQVLSKADQDDDEDEMAEKTEITEQLVLSILDQGHLWPLPSYVKPLVWELDHALRLSPLPHLLVLGDQVEQFSYEYSGCKAVNPGTYSCT